MPGNTPELNLKTAIDADDNADYLVISLASSLQTIDALFNNATGHSHQGAHQGGPIASTPTGSIMQFAGITAPAGWLMCDGTAVSRTAFSALFAVVGTTFGNGDGSTTFNVPDLRGRAPIGAGLGTGLTSRSLGATGGAETHALSVAELAAHSHAVADHNHTQNAHNHSVTDPGHVHDFTSGPNIRAFFGSGSSGVAGGVLNDGTTQVALHQANVSLGNATPTNVAATGVSTQNSGSGTGYNTMPPFLALYYIVKA